MTNCCRKCMKKFCKDRDAIEDCPNCISEVYLHILELNKKLEEDND